MVHFGYMDTILLSRLLEQFPFDYDAILRLDPAVSAVTADSRNVKQGSLFVAMSGGSSDGHRYIPAAIERGASAVVGEQYLDGLSVPYIRVENSRRALASLAAAFYDFPARKLVMIGVTGTDGKTTTSNILYQIMLAAGLKTGMISTVNAVIGSEVLDTGFHVTTPDAPDVQFYLKKMVDSGLTHVILETTSHGWAQYRVDACEFDIGVVTNITHEHLDYHGSYENYRAAKARLFSGLAETLPKPHGNIRLSVLNRDDSSYPFLKGLVATPSVSYGLSSEADYFAQNIVQHARGLAFLLVGAGGLQMEISARLFGLFNVSNILAAASAAIAGLGLSPASVAQGIANLPGVPGRMEQIDLGQSFTAIVDFAHTPNALKVSLETAREMLLSVARQERRTPGRLIAVFGSAGLRDKEKRRMMAEVSARLADVTILTAEDPRTESLDAILEEMARGAVGEGGVEGLSFWRIADRADAIRSALKMAHPGDIVMACGKGHEQSMCFGVTEYLWDDRTAMRAALAEMLGLVGPEMPYLPTSR